MENTLCYRIAHSKHPATMTENDWLDLATQAELAGDMRAAEIYFDRACAVSWNHNNKMAVAS